MRGRMKVGWLAIAGSLSLGLTAQPAQAQTPTRAAIVMRAEQCLRQNVDRVVAAEHDMQSAASFLVNFVCAGEVAGAARYQRNTAYVQMLATMFKTLGQASAAPGSAASGSAASGSASAAAPKPPTPNPMASLDFKGMVDPETGEIVPSPSAPGAPPNPLANLLPMVSNIFGQATPETVPVDLRRLAGELVMAAHAKQH